MRIVTVVSFLLIGCGGSAAPPPSTPAPAANAAIVNGCNGGDYSDHTEDAAAQGTHVKWNEAIASSNDRCLKIRVGGTVTFEGDFAAHPLEAGGGDSGNPFEGAGDRVANPGTPEEYVQTKFEKTGVFGYKCSKHPDMKGAVLVVP